MEPYAPYPLNLLRDWLHRRRWWIRLVLAVILVPWLGHFVHTRWTTPPALLPDAPGSPSFQPALAIPPPEVDRTADIVALFNQLPPEPTLTAPTTAPSGMAWLRWQDAHAPKDEGARRGWAGGQWTFDVSEALVGPWTPETRHHLGLIVSYLETPAVRDALDGIAELSGEPFCLGQLSTGLPTGGMAEVRQLVKLFVARARYHLAGRDDFERAARDIEAALLLAAGIEDDQTLICLFVGMACRSLALSEIVDWSREYELTPDQVRRLTEIISRLSYDRLAAWRTAMTGEVQYSEALVDMLYTKDADGNGWAAIYWEDPNDPRPQSPWLRIGNLLSPLFEDRQTVFEDLRRYQRYMSEVSSPDYAQAKRAMGSIEDRPMKPTSRLAMMPWWFGGASRAYTLLTRTEAEHAGAVVALGLSRYRMEHGAYPEDLSSLVPAYLDELPDDPFSGKPLRYRLDEGQGFVLYSVHDNGTDDGGARSDEYNREELDYPLCESRAEPTEEWVLVPADQVPVENSDDDGEQ